MPFYDYIRIKGLASDYATAEEVQGIGAVTDGSSGSAENPIQISLPAVELSEVVDAIESLQFNDIVAELPGNIRLHLVGKVMTY